MGTKRNAAGKARGPGAGRTERTLQVTGVERASARPDAAELRLGVSVRGMSAREARDLGAETAATPAVEPSHA